MKTRRKRRVFYLPHNMSVQIGWRDAVQYDDITAAEVDGSVRTGLRNNDAAAIGDANR